MRWGGGWLGFVVHVRGRLVEYGIARLECGIASVEAAAGYRLQTAGQILCARLDEPGAWMSLGTIRSDHAFMSGLPSSSRR